MICLSFTKACVVPTIAHFRCGRMAPPHSKRLGLKYVIVHFRNDLTQSQVIHIQVDNTSTYTYLKSTIVGTQLLQGLGGNCMGNNHYRRKEEESKRMYYFGEEKTS